MACPEVKIGRVELASENYEQIQRAADAGQNLWRLDPVETARTVGSASLGFSANDKYRFDEQYYDPGSGLLHAVVRVRHNDCRFLIELYQPEKQGPRGIWVVESVTDL